MGLGAARPRITISFVLDGEPVLFREQQRQRPRVVGAVLGVVDTRRRHIDEPQAKIAAVAIELRHDLPERRAIEHQPALPAATASRRPLCPRAEWRPSGPPATAASGTFAGVADTSTLFLSTATVVASRRAA